MEGFYRQKLDEARKLVVKKRERIVSVKVPLLFDFRVSS